MRQWKGFVTTAAVAAEQCSSLHSTARGRTWQLSAIAGGLHATFGRTRRAAALQPPQPFVLQKYSNTPKSPIAAINPANVNQSKNMMSPF
jgi:hypothetical protein